MYLRLCYIFVPAAGVVLISDTEQMETKALRHKINWISQGDSFKCESLKVKWTRTKKSEKGEI